MNDRLTDEQLDAIDALTDAATAGPWRWNPGKPDSPYGDDESGIETVARVGYDDGSEGPAEYVVSAWGHDAWGLLVDEPDADFIAASRTLVPQLVAELRRARSALDLALGALERIDMDTPEDVALHQRVIQQVKATAGIGPREDS